MAMDEALLLKSNECQNNINEDNRLLGGYNSSHFSCNRIWDGIMCWPPAREGYILHQPCPSYVEGFDTSNNATKLCTQNGWWKNSENILWTNYSGCSNGNYVTMAPFAETVASQHFWVPWIKTISRTGYIVSVSSLVLACSILIFNRKLRCPRNVIHLHLFVSFMMRGSMALLKDTLFEDGLGFAKDIYHITDEISYTQKSHVWHCKVFTTFWQYCIMANYSWILVEGIYLHNLIFLALCSDTSSIFLHVLLGWSIPALFVIPWAISRLYLEDTFCWTTNENRNIFLIIQVPTYASMVMNLTLFINIARVLLKKLNSASFYLFEHRISRYWKWAKSTLVLMPLYGVHYVLFLGLSYTNNPIVEVTWILCDQFFASFQGLFVSILYCILNGEVVQVMAANWRGIKGHFTHREEAVSMWRNGTADEDPCYNNPCDIRHTHI